MKKGLLYNIGLVLALVSACLYAFNVIIEKKYVDSMSSEKILFLMYLGAGVGLFIIHLLTKHKYKEKENKITKKEVPKIMTIVVCELLASFFIIEAVKNIDASLVSLLSIFEIIMTSLCAYLIFKTPIEKNEVIAIIFVLLGSFILNFKNSILSSISLNSLLVIFACLCWGIENNVTASISSKEPALFTSIKCSAVALLYLILVCIKGDFSFNYSILIIFGFFSYGLSILAYALSTKYLGASKATLVFSFSPIFGVLLAFIIYGEELTPTFLISAVLMIIGIIFMNYKKEKLTSK
ncbi:MAG: DMT family transporter [Bacilli bacterium]|nr:DMT family transporter [Bacilli bacterium]